MSSRRPPRTSTPVPVRFTRTGHLVVDVAVDGGHPRPFVVDTGAGASVLALGHDDAALSTRPGSVYDATGRLAGRAVAGHRLQVGDWSTPPLDLVALDLGVLSSRLGEDIGGVIGNDVLLEGVLWLDLRSASPVLVLSENEGISGRTDADTVAVPMTRTEAGLLTLPVVVHGFAMSAVLDLGAGRSVLNPVAHALLPPSNSTPVGSGTASAHGVGDAGVVAVPVELDDVLVAGLRLGPVQVYAAELPVFDALGLEDEPALLLGADMLRGRLVGLVPGENNLVISRTNATVVRSMERRSVAADELLSLLNAELANHDECRGCRFATAPVPRAEPYPDGGNWSRSLSVRGDPADPDACGASAADVIESIAGRFNLIVPT